MQRTSLFRLYSACLSLLLLFTGISSMTVSADTPPVALIPMPASVELTEGTFTLPSEATITVDADLYHSADIEHAELLQIGNYLSSRISPATGYTLQVQLLQDAAAPGTFSLALGGDESLGSEGYELTITTENVSLVAYEPAGLFYGVQTLRQLFPASIESDTAQSGPWTLPTGKIIDTPRYEWRGAMLDVSRHFFSVEDVKRYIDLISAYKLNRLHLHLSDDQGWRIEINSWPELTTVGASTEVGGGEGGFYTQEDYAEIVAYAQERYIIVVPEIDMPGHTNAALASYPELNCDGEPPELYTGTEVGFSSLCIDLEVTYAFLDDVIRELAQITPGPYIHIGGDETQATKDDDYIVFVERVQAIVEKYGKQAVGWEEIGQAPLLSTSIAQHWGGTAARQAVEQGAKVIMSPSSKAYLDMKYDSKTKLGLTWAGLISVETGYNWNPDTTVEGIPAASILGVEAPLWAETLETIEDIEFMAFPRLPGYAEIGWSPQEARDWDEYKIRLAAHGPRFTALGINFYAAPEIEWEQEISR